MNQRRCVVERGRQRQGTLEEHCELVTQLVRISRADLCGSVRQARDELQLVLVHDVVNAGHFVSRLDGRVVEGAATEAVSWWAVENCQKAVAWGCAGGEKGLLHRDPAGVVDATKIPLNQVGLARELLVHRAL
jgi:hypothetical protein